MKVEFHVPPPTQIPSIGDVVKVRGKLSEAEYIAVMLWDYSYAILHVVKEGKPDGNFITLMPGSVLPMGQALGLGVYKNAILKLGELK